MQEFYRLMYEILATEEDRGQDTAQAIDYLWKLAEAEAGPGSEVNAEVLAKVCSHFLSVYECVDTGIRVLLGPPSAPHIRICCLK